MVASVLPVALYAISLATAAEMPRNFVVIHLSILAVPAAALLKLLVPLFYQTLNRRRRRKPEAHNSPADSGA